MKLDLDNFSETEKAALIENRWASSDEIWDVVGKTYKANTAVYENKADWLQFIPQKRRNYQVQANRIFPNMESVINSLIANPPGINVLPSRGGQIAQDFARKLESYFRRKYVDRNAKETVRMGLRNLYFARMIVIKPFWNPLLGQGGDFDFRSVNPNDIRVGKHARKEQDSEFIIEEISDNLCAVVDRFPKKKTELMNKFGFYGEEGERLMYIRNPDVKYKEAWIQDKVIFKLDSIILDTIDNPYWDWDGILVTAEEQLQLNGDENTPALEGTQRRDYMQQIKLQQTERKQAMLPPPEAEQPGLLERGIKAVKSFIQPNEGGELEPSEGATVPGEVTPPDYKTYFFNYFDAPRKPYIFATVFNNENSPIGRTDMITLSAELQRGIDKRKMDIDENCEMVNGILKVDSTVMDKANASRIRFETKGVIWGKGVVAGVQRETGEPLPAMVREDMLDSRSEIDNIMAASSAFRGEREGQETKAGRLALIQQSFLRLNEMVQLTDYVYHEMFSWGMQLAKTRYTEYHYAKWMGKEGAREVIELIQDDFETGSEVTIIAGKTLPVDDEFKFEQAQNDFDKGALGLQDYLEIANYEDPKQKAQNAVTYRLSPIVSVGIPPEEAAQMQPAKEEKPPSVSISYADLTPDAQVQLLEQIGIHADPAIVVAEKMKEHADKRKESDSKNALAEKALEVKQTTPPKKE